MKNNTLTWDNWRTDETFDVYCSPLPVCRGLERERGAEAGGQQLRHFVHDPVKPHLAALVCERVYIENVTGAVRELYL